MIGHRLPVCDVKLSLSESLKNRLNRFLSEMTDTIALPFRRGTEVMIY